MRGDFTRSTFRRTNHFSGVLLQQGRVQVDADWNEEVDIARHRDETATVDLIGRSGAPIHQAGFALRCQDGSVPSDCATDELVIGAGRYYVDGILCENDEDAPVSGDPGQPDLPGGPDIGGPGTYLAYLDVWDRLLTAFERPEIREVALGGPDTATRTKTVWQVKFLALSGGETCLDFAGTPEVPWIPPDAESTGQLAAQGQPADDETTDCLVPAGAGYRRIENQLYRVEIHDPGDLGQATYVWSRDNGCVVAALAQIEDTVVTFEAPSSDIELKFADAKAIELSDEERALRGQEGIVAAVTLVEGNQITVDWGGTSHTMADFGDLPSVRRWEAAPTATAAGFADLEDGVQVSFSSGHYLTGDYWLIPARSLDGTVQWPLDDAGDPVPRNRDGIAHHFAPLAILDATDGGDGLVWTLTSDCRNLFPPVTELTSLFYVGGDGQEVMPDTSDLTKQLPLAEPIEVGVANGEWPVAGATVHFEVTTGNGSLSGVDGSGNVETDPDGIAGAAWSLDSTTAVQRAEATLLDANGNAVGLPVRFTANLSQASDVAYDPGACANLASDRTVQAAVTRLSELAGIRYVSGDGQSVMPGVALEPLRVAVWSPCGPVEGAKVSFAVTAGNGTLQGGAQSTADVSTGADGLATCTWALDGSTASQQVTATLTDAGEQTIVAPAMVTFTANLSVAGQVGYDPSQCNNLAGATTVQEAIDILCQAGGGAEPGIGIKIVELVSGGTLLNDHAISGQQLVGGVRVLCGGSLDPASVNGKPVCIVTVDVPFPLEPSEIQFWDPGLIGYQPLVLAGTVSRPTSSSMVWTPSARAATFLTTIVPRAQHAGIEPPVPVHFTVKGNFVWGVDQHGQFLYVDGDGFGVTAGAETHVRFSTGDGRRGGDLEMWFFLNG